MTEAFFRKVTSSMLIILLITVPLSAQNKTSEYLKGKLDGEIMAKGEPIWFLSGCLLGGLGVILPYVIEPSVPMEHLMGKSDMYTAGFMEGYRQKAKKENFKYAVYGCVTTGVVYIVVYAVLIASIASTVDDEPYYY